MRGDLSPQSKCLLGFVLCFIQLLLPILSLNLDLTFPGSKGLHNDIISQTSFGLLDVYQSWSNIWPSEPHFTFKCNPSMLLFCPQNTTTSQALFLSSPLTHLQICTVCLCVCACFYFPASCTPAQCEGQGTARPAAGDVTPGQATAAMHKIASTDHRPPPICCDSRPGRGCRRLNFSGREQIAPWWAFQH